MVEILRWNLTRWNLVVQRKTGNIVLRILAFFKHTFQWLLKNRVAIVRYGELLKRTEGKGGFDDYNKIALRDQVRVPKFWHTWRTWVNTKKHISGVIPFIRARSLVVSDLRSETKGSRFESGCQLCAEVSLQ